MNVKKWITGSFVLVIAGYIMTGCKPETLQPEGLASFAVTNVAPGSPTVDVLVDGKVTSANRLSYGSTTISVPGATTIYLPVMAGTRQIKFSTDSGKVNNLVDVAGNFEVGKSYTYVILDTPVNGKLKNIRLNDELTLPTSGNVRVRVVHAAPATGTVDVTLLRASGPDSVTLGGLSYVGAVSNPDVAALSKFSSAPGGSYTVKVKQPGTQTVLLQSALTLTAGRIYTIFVRGGAQSQPLSIASSANY
ncbi:MAG: DUF4397 domain-containing protein [Flavisolibacter sp.]